MDRRRSSGQGARAGGQVSMVARVSSTVVWSRRTDGFRPPSSAHAAMILSRSARTTPRGEEEVLTGHRADGPLSSFDARTGPHPPMMVPSHPAGGVPSGGPVELGDHSAGQLHGPPGFFGSDRSGCLGGRGGGPAGPPLPGAGGHLLGQPQQAPRLNPHLRSPRPSSPHSRKRNGSKFGFRSPPGAVAMITQMSSLRALRSETDKTVTRPG